MNKIVESLRRNLDIEALIESGDVNKMKRVLLLKRGILTPDEKGDLIVAIGDPEFMKACARDITMGLDRRNLTWIIIKTNDKDYIEKQIRSMKFKKSSHDKAYMAKYLRDPERMKKYLYDKNIKPGDKCELILRCFDIKEIVERLETNEFGLDSTSKGAILRRLPLEDRCSCIRNPKVGLDAHDKGMLIDSIWSDSERAKFDNILMDVDKISETSLEQLEALPDDGIVRIRSAKKEEQYDYYSKTEFIAIKKVADKILEGIERPKKDDQESELAVFKTIYARLAKLMAYDNAAIKEKNKGDEKWQRDCRNLYGLVTGKTVCAGYACILVQMLQEMGMDAQYIRGNPKNNEPGHAWTQVKIGRKMV